MAAIVLSLVAAAAVAYVIPFSPLPDWIDSVRDRGAEPSAPRSSVPVPGSALPGETVPGERPPRRAPVETLLPPGIAVEPGPEFVVEFSSAQASGEVFVSLRSSRLLSVRVVSGTARFDSDAERLGILVQGSAATYEIELPEDAPSVDIRLAGRVLLTKRGAEISGAAPLADGRYRLPLGR